MTRIRMAVSVVVAFFVVAVATTATAAAAPSGAAAWGDNAAGQLGDGTTSSTDAPVAVSGVNEVKALAAGGEHSLALLGNGTVLAWGQNSAGQLGNGTTTSSDVPVAVSGLSGVIAIAAGEEDSLALLSNGTVKSWGANGAGQLGNGTIAGSDVPVAVSGITTATAIAASLNHSMALLANGTVMGWGENTSGQVGDGTIDSGEVTPVAVTGLTGATAIAAGADHSLAVVAGGAVESWGENSQGQLGNGSMTNSDVPVSVTGLSGAKSVSAGARHSLALLSSGAVMAWGANARGELGNGSTTVSNVPVAVSGITTATAVAAGGQHSAALLSTGTVTDWGDNSHGELGNGTMTASSVPVTVSGLTGATGIAASELSTLAVGPQVTTVTAVSPAFGSPSGGTTVKISGLNLTGATAVHFGSASAASFTPESATSLTAVSPAGAGVVDVTVTTPKGTSSTREADRFSYLPGVTSVTPNTGPQAGGTPVTITGTNFEDVTAVKFGANPASGVKVESTTVIKATAPAGADTVEVTVTTSGGVSPKSAGDVFTYTGAAPEFGRCVKVKRRAPGSYSDAGCTKRSEGGKYEWLAGPGSKNTFTTKTAKDSKFVLEAAGGGTITCASEKSGGQYTGVKTVGDVVLTLTACESATGKCTSGANKAGVLETKPLEGALGIIKAGAEGPASDQIGLDLKAVGGGVMVEFTCGTIAGAWRGSVIVPLQTDKPLKSAKLQFKGASGIQEVEMFEGQPKDVIESSLSGGPYVQSDWNVTTTQNNKEAIEVNTVV